ncbi:MAG: DUF3108 domain-containing protein [Burkholderiales bacterium]|nr:DUF3108 domain-containing protein [Burkholderiales bacterium]
MRRSDRLMAAAAAASLVAHLALIALLPDTATDAEEREPLAVELRSEPPPVTLPPRRLPPKPKMAKPPPPPQVEAPPLAEPPPVIQEAMPEAEPSGESEGAPGSAGGDLPSGSETAVEEVPAPLLAEETAAEEPPALLAVQGLATSADLRFNVLRGEGKVGEVVWRWRKAGERYRIETVGTASGVAAMFFGGEYRQTSEGRIGANGLTPERYTFERGSLDKLDLIMFDWAAGKALVNDAKGRSREFDLVPGTQDLMSFLHQLPLLPTDAISIPLATIKRQRDYSFSAPQTVRIKVPAGEMEAYYYQRIGAATEAEVWLQHQPPYLPIRIRLYDRLGNRFEQVLTHIEFQP